VKHSRLLVGVVALALTPQLSWALGPVANASTQTPAPVGVTADAEARAWFARIQAAANKANYHGTLVFSAGGAVSSSRVGHYVVGEQTYEVLEALDGRQQRILRHNDTVHTLWPQTKLAVVETREILGGRSTTPQRLDPLALEHYDIKREGTARVAGRDAVVFVLEPRDTLRYAQRFWADRETALMLRADVLAVVTSIPLSTWAANPVATPPGSTTALIANAPRLVVAPLQTSREVLESAAFSVVEIGVKAQPDAVLQAMQKQDGYRIHKPQQKRTSLEAEGWQLARAVPGFQVAGCVQRGLDHNTSATPEPVMQTVFTDGLTHVSLFVEPFKPNLHRAETQHQQGATASVTLRRGEHWFTAVGDVPAATLRRFAEALERRNP
jgi:sigma-E factor negative regulatory protein RseB